MISPFFATESTYRKFTTPCNNTITFRLQIGNMWRWWCFSLWLYLLGPIAKTTTFGSIFCVIIGRSQIFVDTQGAEFCNHFWQWYLCYIDVGLWACWLLAGTVTRRNHLIQTVSSNYAEYEAFQEEIASGLPCSTWLLEVRCKVDCPRGVKPTGERDDLGYFGKTPNCTESCTESLRTLDQDTISSQS